MKKCKRCGTKNDLLVHHKNRNHFDNRARNRETLCRSCHGKEHLKDGVFKPRTSKQARKTMNFYWSQPEWRARQLVIRRSKKFRKRHSEIAKAQWKDKEFREKQKQHPKQSTSMKKVWDKPGYKEHMSKKLKAAWRRRKLERRTPEEGD